MGYIFNDRLINKKKYIAVKYDKTEEKRKRRIKK